MGIFDGFFDKEKKEQKRYSKLEKTLTNMYVQTSERMLIIQTLVELETEEAIRILLTRFRESAPNSTVDLDEKQRVYESLVMLGRQPKVDVIGTIVKYLQGVDGHVNWPLKVLTDCLDLAEFTDVLVALLDGCSTEYAQDPQKKQELILRASEFKSPAVAEQLLRFLGDMNETVRFHTIESLLSQEMTDEVQAALRDTFIAEESLRIVQKLSAAFEGHHEWKFPEAQHEGIQLALPDAYGLHKNGHIYLRR